MLVLLFIGVAGSGHFNRGGGGSELICLHNHPTWRAHVASLQYKSYIAGVEYDIVNHPFSTSNNGKRDLWDNDMPCAVCQARGRSAQIMIPARDECPHGWKQEYWGYLVAPHAGQPGGMYTCRSTEGNVHMQVNRGECTHAWIMLPNLRWAEHHM